MREPYNQVLIENEEQMKLMLVVDRQKYFGGRVQKAQWTGPGWYYLFKYIQRCPRNCCDDMVFEIVSASEWASTIADEMKVLSAKLKEARGYATMPIQKL